MAVASVLGEGQLSFMSTEFQLCKMKKILEMNGGNGYTTVWMYFNAMELDT